MAKIARQGPRDIRELIRLQKSSLFVELFRGEKNAFY
jgi:hypothetical protein